jgi:hypothetical protein
MDKQKIILLTILTVAIIGLAYNIIGRRNKNWVAGTTNIQHKPSLADSALLGYESIITGTTSPGDVSIELKPHQQVNGKLEVDVWVNTHSVDLSQFDLEKAVMLDYDGKQAAPTSAPKLGGHHVSGTITFEVEKDVQSFTITIEGIPLQEVRTYTWR